MTYEELEKLENLEARIGVRLDHLGREVPDPTPMSMPSGFKRPETLAEQVQRLVRTQVSRQAEEAGFETFEDSEDFDVDDDFDPTSPYEAFFDPALNREISADEFNRNHELYKKRYMQAQQEYFSKIDEQEIMEENLIRRAAQERKNKSPNKGGEGVSPSPSSEEA